MIRLEPGDVIRACRKARSNRPAGPAHAFERYSPSGQSVEPVCGQRIHHAVDVIDGPVTCQRCLDRLARRGSLPVMTPDEELIAAAEADAEASERELAGDPDEPILDHFGYGDLTPEEIANSDPESPAFQSLDGQ